MDDLPVPAVLRQVLRVAAANTYTPGGNAWRQLIASLAYGTQCNLALIRELDEQDQAKFLAIIRACLTGEMEKTELRQLYRESFPHPQVETGDGLRDA